MHRLLIAILLLWPLPVSAALYYFSDCATGGAGTIDDPYCVDPGNDGTKDWIEFLMNGTGAEVAAGDTIYLCTGAGSGVGTADDCDGAGSGTYYVNTEASPAVSGNSGSHITITVYCSGANCETVTVSGDANNDGDWDTGTEPTRIINNSAAVDYYDILGDPNDDGVPNLILTKTSQRIINANAGGGDWLIDGVELSYAGWISLTDNVWDITGTEGFWENGCTTSDGNVHAGLYVQNATGPWTLRDSIIHHICDFGTRINLNDSDATAIFVVHNNEFYNMAAAINDYGNLYGSTYTSNYVHDTFGGIGVEKGVKHALIENNTIACLGEYNLGGAPADGEAFIRTGYCKQGIAIEYDSTTPPFDVLDMVVRGNTIYATSLPTNTCDGEGKDNGNGYMRQGIVWYSYNPTDADMQGFIENNMIWNIQPSTCGDDNANCASTFNATEACSAINVETKNWITIRNNTVYYAKWPLKLNSTDTTDVAHIVTNNLFIRGVDSAGTNTDEIAIFTDAITSVFTNNNVYDFGAGALGVNFQTGTDYTCATVNTLGTGNKCSVPVLVKCDSGTACNATDADEATWNLHLHSSDTADIDAGTTGSATDIDGDARPQPPGGDTDIGADEYQAAAAPRIPLSGRATVSGRCAVQ